MNMALEGIRVLDMTVWHHGPGAATLLADMGAEVIKIEERLSGDPGRHSMSLGNLESDNGLSYYFENNNRNKKGLAIDLKKERGREVMFRLVEKSDVLLSNFRKAGLERLGLGYDELKKRNPRLIYAHGSGQGTEGPHRGRPSNDIIGQFWGGFISYGSVEGPMPVWSDLADRGGAVSLAFGTALAILARERTGIAQEVNTSLLGGQIYLGAVNIQRYLFEGRVPSPLEKNGESPTNPFWNVYQASDEGWLCLGCSGSDEEWRSLCRALGLDGAERDPRFDTIEKRTTSNSAELVDLLQRKFGQRPLSEWKGILEKSGLVWAPLRAYSEVLKDPQVLENEYIVDLEHPNAGKLKYLGLPVRLSKTPGKVRMPAPDLGQHTEEILTDICGYSWEDVAELKAQEVIN
ncbi:MAG: CaiB/BaiF CoA transferase family protein [Dehalococcoidia bacterium]